MVCDTGKFQPSTGGQGCKNCAADKYQTATSSGSCTSCDYFCPDGMFHTACGGSGAGDCNACPAGQFKTSGVAQSCESCPAGRYAATSGRSSCDAADGTTEFQDVPGQETTKSITVCTDTQHESAAPGAQSSAKASERLPRRALCP